MTYDHVIGVDVGKYFHHACVLDPSGTTVQSTRVEQSEAALTEFFTQFTTTGSTLVVVDQPNNIGRLTVTIAKATGADVKYLPGLSMRQLARIHAGNSKTDIRDAFVIAYAGRFLPDALRAVDRTDPIFQQLKALNGIDDDLTRAYTRLINQIRSSLVGTYPEFERVLCGSVIHRRWILELLARYGGPTKLRRLGRSRTITCAKKRKARNPAPIVDALFDAITSQQLTLPGAGEAELGVALAATDALAKLDHRKRIHQQVPEIPDIIDQLPLIPVLLSMPGIGPATAAQPLMTTGDFSDFKTAAQLASYADLCPTTNQSGTSLNSHSVNRAGNKRLNNALWQSSFSAIIHHERSRHFYERKRQEGKRHNAAVVCLARTRLNVLFAMVKNVAFYSEDYANTP